MKIPAADRNILRELARRVAELAADPVMAGRRRRWVAHNALRSREPRVLVFPEGAWCELLPASALRCATEDARALEWELRRRIYGGEHFRDDAVVEKNWIVSKRIASSGWGLEARWIPSPEARGARHFDPVIKGPADLARLRFPEISYDEKSSRRAWDEIRDLFGDILDVTLEGVKHISYHLMSQWTALRGLEEVMLDMYAEPQLLHAAMAFLEEGQRRMLRQYVDQNLLALNNDNTYQNSGGNGYTDELPRPDADPGRVRPQDMWASAEAQEMAQVSPAQHAEFILPYEKRLLLPFGLTGYGCCEDLTRKLGDVFTLPRLRRISISPWSDVAACAEALQGKYIFSWKPNPAQLVGRFDEHAIRENIRRTVEVARRNGCVLEMILKDTHTCENHPERFGRWTQIAREVVRDAS